ncbi:MAG TPA: cytochrome c-type biogenesis CcmF C-terminal domain-containing protein, partial [Gemmatimonadaceae bacterium]|nr:cytochrome c-type biogenesis CcmF C-terminal domain-containing protein [Gemmatimonadaceae bacterium]
AAFLYNNLLLVGIAFSVLWGTLFPILSEAVRGSKITVGPPFFNAVNIPLGLLLLLLTGIGPLIAWRRASVANLKRQFAFPTFAGLATLALLLASGMREVNAVVSYTLAGFVAGTIAQEFYKGIGARRRMHGESVVTALVRLVARNRRRYGGYIVHAGVVILFCAFAGLAFKRENDVTLHTGQTYETTDPYGHHWAFVSQGLSQFDQLNRHVVAITLKPTRDGKPMPLIESEKRQHFDSRGQASFEPSTAVGIQEGLAQDVYVVLAGATNEDTAEIRITFNPLVWWVWYGGMIMAVGGLIVMWPQADRARAKSGYRTVLAPAHAEAR